MDSSVPVMNGSMNEMICEMNHILFTTARIIASLDFISAV